MKIIGVIPVKYRDNKYIVEIEHSEIQNLMGYKYSDKQLDEKIVVGNEIPIAAMYERLYRMANQEKELMEVSAKLKAAADFCNTALPVIKTINQIDGEDNKS
jgi:RNA polymerase-interacting CarD/CdnL/TRCF family regulator